MSGVVTPLVIRDGKDDNAKSRLKLKISTDERDKQRIPPSFLPPDLPMPSAPYSRSLMQAQLQHTPAQSPIASPFRYAPSKLMDTLILEEATYLKSLRALQAVIQEKLGGDGLACLTASVEKMIDLASELRSTLSHKSSYFSDPQKDCLLHFSQVVTPAYQAYFKGFFLGLALDAKDKTRMRELLAPLEDTDDIERDLDWLLRRPLSRVRSYTTLYKKLLHSSEDATDLFLAHETFQSLLAEARETLDRARKERTRTSDVQILPLRLTQRSISGGSTSTQSSSSSRLSASDELTGLQNSINTSFCKDIFSLGHTTCKLDFCLPSTSITRAVVNRENFQLVLVNPDSETAIDCLVELILLTDQLLITRPSFEGPNLMFPPLLRGVFHVSCVSQEPRLLELDIVGRQTLRFTAASKQARLHWYDLLLACEDYKLDVMPTITASTGAYIKSNGATPWMPLAPVRMPPTPPHTICTPTFGGFAPLGVIREDSQLSIADFSDHNNRTPDAHDHQPFHFDVEDDTTPKADNIANPMERPVLGPLCANESSVQPLRPKQREINALSKEEQISESLQFPQPPARSMPGSVVMKKSKTLDLFSTNSYTEQFLAASQMNARSMTLQHPVLSPKLATGKSSPEAEQSLAPQDLDFTKDEEFDESLLDLPTLPAFDFGDGIRRPSSVALKFSPNTMLNFGIPMRKVAVPKPMVIPEVDPLRTASLTASLKKPLDTISQRRNVHDLTLDTAASTHTKVEDQGGRSNLLSIMAECYTWDNGTWAPIIMDEIDAEGKLKAVRSSQVTVFERDDRACYVELFDKKDQQIMNQFGISDGTSVIRDDPCDLSIGFDVGADKVYYMFRCENPDKANAMQRSIAKAKMEAPGSGRFITSTLPVTPLWPVSDDSTTLIDSLKTKLYLFDNGKWINKGSARLTIKMIANARARRLILTGKTKKNQRIMLVDCITAQQDCEAISKTGISVRTNQNTYMVQFKGGEKERARILALLKDY